MTLMFIIIENYISLQVTSFCKRTSQNTNCKGNFAKSMCCVTYMSYQYEAIMRCTILPFHIKQFTNYQHSNKIYYAIFLFSNSGFKIYSSFAITVFIFWWLNGTRVIHGSAEARK